jgi:hypothetical protein
MTQSEKTPKNNCKARNILPMKINLVDFILSSAWGVTIRRG